MDKAQLTTQEAEYLAMLTDMTPQERHAAMILVRALEADAAGRATPEQAERVLVARDDMPAYIERYAVQDKARYAAAA